MALNVSEKDILVALQNIHVGKVEPSNLREANPHILKTIEILGFMDSEQRLTASGKAFMSIDRPRRS